MVPVYTSMQNHQVGDAIVVEVTGGYELRRLFTGNRRSRRWKKISAQRRGIECRGGCDYVVVGGVNKGDGCGHGGLPNALAVPTSV